MPKVVPSTCWECSTCCGALLTLEEGRVTDVAPNPQHPASRGAFCIKGIRGMPGIAYFKLPISRFSAAMFFSVRSRFSFIAAVRS